MVKEEVKVMMWSHGEDGGGGLESHANLSFDLLKVWKKKEEIWLSPTTKAPSPTKKSKKQRYNTKMPQKIRLHNDCGPT